MPVRSGLVNNTIVITFITSASTGTVMNWENGLRIVFFFYMICGSRIGIGVCVVRRGIAHRRARAIRTRRGLATLSSGLTSFVRSSHCSVQRGKIAHHALVLLLFICMHGLSMLTQIIQTRELFPAVTTERAFTRVFPDGLRCKKKHTEKKE
jgi:hypothetical protein